MIKCLTKLGIEEHFLNVIKDIYKITTFNIVFNGEYLNAFSTKSGTSIGYCPGVPKQWNRQKKL